MIIMKYFQCGEIGTKIARVGIGTARMGTVYDEEQSFEMLDIYSEKGGNVFDTARNYYEWVDDGRGKSEECLGKWLDQRGKRTESYIITKGGTYGRGSKNVSLSLENLICDLEHSLEALRTDKIDIYVLHKDETARSIEEIVESVQVLKEKGNISIVGVDDWDFERLYQANSYAERHNLEPFKSIETWWSLAEYTKEFWNNEATKHMTNTLEEYIAKRNMIGIAVSPQCKGFFQKAIKEGYEAVDEFLKHRIVTEKNIKKLKYIKDFCEKEHISPTAVIIGYITSKKLNSIAIIGASNSSQLLDVLENSDYELCESIIEEIESI